MTALSALSKESREWGEVWPIAGSGVSKGCGWHVGACLSLLCPDAPAPSKGPCNTLYVPTGIMLGRMGDSGAPLVSFCQCLNESVMKIVAVAVW